jgi:hypothetical protein
MKLCIATPMYGGNAKSVYINAIADFVNEIVKRGHSVVQVSVTNESLITRARNTLAYEFLNSTDCDALLFVDGDHGFNPMDVADMIESGKDLIGAIYPMKSINWENVRQAALLGKPNLDEYSGFFAANFLSDNQTFQSNEPFKVLDIGTGMMFVTRKVFEDLEPICKKYKNNSIGSNMPMGKEIVEYFTTSITEEGVLLSEDYEFCRLWRSLGNDVYAAPWVRITHAGEYSFSGNFLRTLELNNEIEAIIASKSSKEEPATEPLTDSKE